MAGVSATLFAILGCLAFISCEAASSAPAFLWSNQGYLANLNLVDYRVLPFHQLVEGLFTHLPDQKASEEGATKPLTIQYDVAPEVVAVYVSKMLTTADLSRWGAPESDPLASLKGMLGMANSSVSLPYVDLAVASGEDTLEKLVREFRAAGGALVAATTACKSRVGALGVDHVDAAESLANHVTSGPALLIDCGPEAEAAAEAQEAVVERPVVEGASFGTLLHRVEEKGHRYVALFMSESAQPLLSTAGTSRRSLADAFPGDICDETCQTKAHLLEVLAVALILLTIWLSGLCCLNAVDTPTRFEAPKEN